MTATAEVLVRNAQGFHMRPITAFTKLAGTFNAKVTVSYGKQTADGVSIIACIGLAVPKGATLRIVADGPQEAEAVKALVQLVDNCFGLDHTG